MEEAVLKFFNLVEEVTGHGRIAIERPDLTRASVLVPIVFHNEKPNLIVTKRTETVATHKGQISFPGGVREPEDRDEVENALREAHEEIGLDPALVSVVGLLDDFATTTGFAITPVVGFVAPDAVFEIDPVEVAELIEVPIATLKDASKHELITKVLEGIGYSYHRYQVGEHVIWGATAGIIHRFLTALDEKESQ
ncbi:MAG: CoA pyrophosphatase [Proteobacteria bacterium]|nr:CoA pyrophosphatase [Pseudomonadota bacterium]